MIDEEKATKAEANHEDEFSAVGAIQDRTALSASGHL